MNCVGSSEYMPADQSSSWLITIDHFVTILPYYSLKVLQNVQNWQYLARF